ncbi:MAG: polysaccharide deacetylase family protein [Bacillus sp. (in: firmicutes)]
MKQKWTLYLNVIFIGLFSWLIVQSAYVHTYITHLKEQQAVTVSKKANPLLEEVKQKAEQYEIAPKDAMIDSVWKTVPGYNGLQVDIQASYENMKKEGVFTEKRLIYKEIPPNKHLSQLEAAPIYRAHPDKPVVSFLINVAWGNEYIPSMLLTLKKHNVKATFFLEGKWAKNNPDLVKMMHEAGHEIGNHSYSHPNMQTLSTEQTRQQITETSKIIKAITGESASLFAPPSGAFRDETVKIAREYGLHTIMWSVDTIDWQRPPSSVLIERVMSKVHQGAFILMHPTKPTSESLEELIVQIKKRNLHIKTVSDALSEERIMH